MKLISWNVNGIRACIAKGFLEFVKNKDPDVLCLQEVKANSDYLLELPGYEQYWNYAEKKGYSGVAVFAKNKALSIAKGIGISDHDKEGRVVTLEFDGFYLVNAYIPNSKRGLLRLDYRKQWDNDFLNYLKKLEKTKPVVLCGDLNVAHTDIDLANAKSNYNKTAGYSQVEIDGFENMLNAGFIDTFRIFNNNPKNYTWWSYMFNARAKNVGWRIDYFIVSGILKSKVRKSVILNDILGSDHCPVELELK